MSRLTAVLSILLAFALSGIPALAQHGQHHDSQERTGMMARSDSMPGPMMSGMQGMMGRMQGDMMQMMQSMHEGGMQGCMMQGGMMGRMRGMPMMQDNRKNAPMRQNRQNE